MNIHSFIFNWKGHERNATRLEEKLAALGKVTVINSEEVLSRDHPAWIHLDDTAYFSAQWNKALELFEGDTLFHIQADVEFDHFDALFSRATSLWERYRVGVYEPDIDVTIPWFRYDRSKLQPLEANLFEIPMSDCTCWFIHGGIVRKLPRVDVSINKYGWGVCGVIAALGRLNGRSCLRDYSFTVRHPRGRGYSSGTAEQQRDAYLDTLSPEVRKETLRLDQLRRSVTEREQASGRLRAFGPITRRALGLLRHLRELRDRG